MTRASRGDTRIISTNVTRRSVAIISRAHAKRAIVAISGPAGIGKTAAIQLAKRKYCDRVIIVTPRQVNTPAREALRLTINALRARTGVSPIEGEASTELMQRKLVMKLRMWFGGRFVMELVKGSPVRATIIFDESQNLSLRAIVAMRDLNNAAPLLRRPTIGLVFVGETSSGRSDWTEVVAGAGDHPGSIERFNYNDLPDDDIQRVVQANGLKSPAAMAALLDYCRQQPANRDLRAVVRIVRDAKHAAGSEIPSAADINRAIGGDFSRA
jgi:hypothetical protein